MKALKIIMVVLVVVLPLIVFAFGGSNKQGVVSSEPIPCFQLGEKMVCFEGALSGNLHCELADATTILCSEQE